jgi:hypothetical protein
MAWCGDEFMHLAEMEDDRRISGELELNGVSEEEVTAVTRILLFRQKARVDAAKARQLTHALRTNTFYLSLFLRGERTPRISKTYEKDERVKNTAHLKPPVLQ